MSPNPALNLTARKPFFKSALGAGLEPGTELTVTGINAPSGNSQRHCCGYKLRINVKRSRPATVRANLRGWINSKAYLAESTGGRYERLATVATGLPRHHHVSDYSAVTVANIFLSGGRERLATVASPLRGAPASCSRSHPHFVGGAAERCPRGPRSGIGQRSGRQRSHVENLFQAQRSQPHSPQSVLGGRPALCSHSPFHNGITTTRRQACAARNAASACAALGARAKINPR